MPLAAYGTQGVTFMYCKDLDASTKFYTDVLRLPLSLTQRPPGEDKDNCRIFAVTPSCFLGAVLADNASKTGTAVVAVSLTPCRTHLPHRALPTLHCMCLVGSPFHTMAARVCSPPPLPYSPRREQPCLQLATVHALCNRALTT